MNNKIRTVWQSAWCSVGGDEPVQAKVGKSPEGFHAGLATGGNVAWGPATPDQASAKVIAQAATSQALERRSAAKEFGAAVRIAPTQGRSRS